MSSVDPEQVIFTTPSGRTAGGVNINTIIVPNITVSNLTVTTSIGGAAVPGGLATIDGVQTLTNKTIIGGTSGNVISANQLFGVDIDSAAPIAGQGLIYSAGKWTPSAVSAGTVTSVGTGTGLTGGPITTTGTITLANTTVTPGAYTNTSLTVDQQGRLTAASSGAAPVLSVGAGTGVTITGTATAPIVNLANTTAVPGSYTYTALTVDAQGRLTAASNGTTPVTSVGTGTGLTGGPITSTGTVTLADTLVTPGSYTNVSLTVDQQGRLTAASSGATPVLSVSAGTGVTITGTATAPIVNLANTTAVPGSYTNASLTVDAQGRLTAASSGIGAANTFLTSDGATASFNALSIGAGLTGNGVSTTLNLPTTALANSRYFNWFFDINQYGVVTAAADIAGSYGYSFRQLTQSIPNNTNTALLANNLDASFGNSLTTGGLLNTGTGIYTTPVSGWYSATACVAWTSNATGQRILDILLETGVGTGTYISISRSQASPVSTGPSQTAATQFYVATAGVRVYVQLFQNSGGALVATFALSSLMVMSTFV